MTSDENANTASDESASNGSDDEASCEKAISNAKSLEAAGIAHDITVRVNDKDIILSGKASYVFVDVFEYIDFDLSRPQGRTVVTTLNGKNAQYMEKITEGDEIEIRWTD